MPRALRHCGHNDYLSPLHCISISTDNASVNDVLISMVSRILLAKYGIPPSPNLHIRCVCHVVNLVVQAILAALGEADDPDEIDYYALNKKWPVHLDINSNPDQIELDREQFREGVDSEDDSETTSEENMTLEDEERVKATESPLSKACISAVNFSCFRILILMFSYALSQTKSSHHRSDRRNFGNVQSRYIRRNIQSTRTGERP